MQFNSIDQKTYSVEMGVTKYRSMGCSVMALTYYALRHYGRYVSVKFYSAVE